MPRLSRKAIEAVLWDLDGVIVHTDQYHTQAWELAAQEIGVHLTDENNAYLHGLGRKDSAAFVYTLANFQPSAADVRTLMDRKNVIYQDFISSLTPNDVVPGVRELLLEIRNSRRKQALVSSSENARMVLELLHMTDMIDAIVDGKCTPHHKPRPDLWLIAAGQLAASSVLACLAIDDSRFGIEGAIDAGMQALGIGPRSRFPRGVRSVPTLANKKWRDLFD